MINATRKTAGRAANCAAFLGLFCTYVIVADAQTPGPISTERPSFSFSPLALGQGLWQIETGYLYTRDEASVSLKESTLPNLLLRFGFHENFELQLSNVNYNSQTVDGIKASGALDPGLGVKWQINNEDASVPVALFGGISLPVGNTAFSSDEYTPSLGLFWTHSNALSWFGTAMLSYPEESFTFDNAIGLSFSVLDTSSVFLEYLGSFSEQASSESTHSLNTGMTWLLSDKLQLDINGSVGLNNAASDYAVGAGLSYRF